MNRLSTERNIQQLGCVIETLVTLRTHKDRQCSRVWPVIGTLDVLNSGPSGARPGCRRFRSTGAASGGGKARGGLRGET